ncbi:uncharacterized protein TNCV_4424181 [Trichonephila clavipes]|nr:uncharacterized protein TNCV_4424181 [Trichonephila clavipes]
MLTQLLYFHTRLLRDTSPVKFGDSSSLDEDDLIVFMTVYDNKEVKDFQTRLGSSRRPSGDESKGRRSNKGTAGLEDLRLKRKVKSNGTMEKNDRKRSKISRKRSYQGSEHRDQKRPTPVIPQGIKRTVPSSVASKTHKYGRQEFNPSQGTASIAAPSHQQDARQCNPPTEESRRGARVQYDKVRETRTTHSKGHSTAEGRPVRSRQTTAVRPCPYYLRSRLNEPEGTPEEHWNRQSTAEQPREKEPQHGSLRRRSGG